MGSAVSVPVAPWVGKGGMETEETKGELAVAVGLGAAPVGPPAPPGAAPPRLTMVTAVEVAAPVVEVEEAAAEEEEVAGAAAAGVVVSPVMFGFKVPAMMAALGT